MASLPPCVHGFRGEMNGKDKTIFCDTSAGTATALPPCVLSACPAKSHSHPCPLACFLAFFSLLSTLLHLQVRTLQLEMEYVHGALEEEARDITGDSKEGADLSLALSRRGSSDEVALLVAGATRWRWVRVGEGWWLADS